MTLLPQTAQPLKHVLWGVQVNKGLLISNTLLLDLLLTSDDEDMYADVNKTSKNTIICYVFMVVTTEVHAKYTSFLWPPYVIAQTIIFSCCGFYLLSIFYLFFLAKSQRSEIGCLPYFDTWCGPSANLECRSETCCARLAENT